VEKKGIGWRQKWASNIMGKINPILTDLI